MERSCHHGNNLQQSYMTVEEYLQLDNESPDARYDYIDGQVIRLAGGSPQHAEIGTNALAGTVGSIGKP